MILFGEFGDLSHRDRYARRTKCPTYQQRKRYLSNWQIAPHDNIDLGYARYKEWGLSCVEHLCADITNTGDNGLSGRGEVALIGRAIDEELGQLGLGLRLSPFSALTTCQSARNTRPNHTNHCRVR